MKLDLTPRSADLRGLPEEVQRYASLDTSVLVGSTSQTFDAKGRLTDLVHAGSVGQTLVNYHYVRDLADQLIAETHHGSTWEYTRDDFGQLLTSTVNGVPAEDYAYDDHGNRTTAGLITGTDNRLLENATHAFTYDAEGNLTRRTEKLTGHYTEYVYDHRNRLTQATEYLAGSPSPVGEVTFVYDVFDRQIGRMHDADGSGPLAEQARYTVYDGVHAWADYDGNGQVTARYLFGDGVDQIAARWRPGEGTAWYLTDHLGTVREIVNGVGTIIQHLDCDSFGRILSQTNPAAGDRFAFSDRSNHCVFRRLLA